MNSNLIKRLLILTLLSLITNIAFGVDVTYNGLKYSVDTTSKTATCNGLAGGGKGSGDLVIPDYIEYNGGQYPVTEIGNSAFSGCSGFTGSLTIGNSVTTIGESAFYKCSGFTGSLTIGNSVTTIGENAFYGCSGFTGSLTIPDSVTEIGENAFYGCSGFTGSLTISDSVTEIGGNAFFSCSGFTGSLTIPDSVTTIGERVFYGCSGFTGSLTIPHSVTEIGRSAFSNCSGFTGSLTIPNSVTTIGESAFSGCSGFTGSLTIGNSVTTIGESAFYKCSGFTGSLTIPDSVTEIGEHAFYRCLGFTGSLKIPDSVTTIGEYAFDGCSGFNGSLTIGNSVTEIGRSAFFSCSGFSGSLTIPNSVTKIGHVAFDGCSGFTGSLTIPDSVTEIGQAAFSDCSGFTGSLTIPNSVTTIGSVAFYGCSGFNGSLTIGNSVTKIDQYAFYGCSGFTGSLKIPDSVTTIGEYAFDGCSGFTGSLTIGNSVTKIDQYAFYGCSGFTGSLTIGNSVTEIGHAAFYGCSGFTGSLTIPDSVTTIEYSAFSGCSGFTGSLTIPDSVTTIGSGAFHGCSGFTGSLTIPNSVTEIGNGTFYDCSGFTGSLTIPNSVTTIGSLAFHDCSGFTGPLTIPNSVTSIGDWAFYGCSGFTGTLSLGESVSSIGPIAFYYTNFTKVDSYNLSPPTCQSEIFSTYPKQLYVPGASIDLYKAADVWKNFSYIGSLEGTEIEAESISLSDTTLTLIIGSSSKLTAKVYPEDTTDPAIVWESDNEKVATVAADGTVTAVNVGTANITATCGNVSATCMVTVKAPEPIGIRLSPLTMTLQEGETGQFEVTFSPNNAESNLTWNSSDPSIVDVNNNGVVKAIKPGMVVITVVSDNGVTGMSTVRVVDNSVAAVNITPDNLTLDLDESVQLSAQVSPEAAGSEIVWSSRDPEVAIVDENGLVTAVGKGVTVIYARTDNGVTGIATVTVVNSQEVASVTIVPGNLEMLEGTEQQLEAIVQPGTASPQITWLSLDPAVAEVSDNGLLRALSPGVTVIYALSENGMTGLATVKVVSNEVTAVTIDPDLLALEIDETGQFRAVIEPFGADAALTWSSSDPTIATVDNDGVVKGKGQGYAFIYATASNGVTGIAIAKVTDPNAGDNPDLGYGDNGVYVSAVRIREGDPLELFAERPTGYENNDWRYEWYLNGSLEAEGKYVIVTAGQEAGWTGNSMTVDTESYEAQIYNLASDLLILELPKVSVYSRPLTPEQLVRKGDGASHSFIAMSSIPDSELARLGYSFYFGYTDAERVNRVIYNGTSRYCHTSQDIYSHTGYRFWVYTSWTFPDGATITSGLRYLDGELDESFDRSDFNFSTRGAVETIEGDYEINIFTLEGHSVGKDLDRLAPGLYIIRERNGNQVTSRKIIKN